MSPDRSMLHEATSPQRAPLSRDRQMRLRLMLLALSVACGR